LNIFSSLFFTSKEEGKGTGLGLAAVYGTVKNHSGGIALNSVEGMGTAVSLYLPLHIDAGFQLPEETGSTKPGVCLNKHVLVVDDEEQVREMAAAMLESAGCRVTVCNNGIEALEIYRQQKETIDLVVLNLVMPVMDGAATFKQLKEIDPDVHVLIASGYSIESDAQKLLKEGAKAFIQKPFLKLELMEKLEMMLQ
jgi:CheY-like chemotaxis protein